MFISSSGFSCFSHRVCSRAKKPQKVLISNFFEVLRLYLILSIFLSIPCAQGTTLIKQCSKVSTKTYQWSLKVVLLFLEVKLLLRYQTASFFAFPSSGNRQQWAVFYTVNNERYFRVFVFGHRAHSTTRKPRKISISSLF